MFKYLLRNTGAGSAKYGNCEVCQKPADTVFIQMESKQHEYTTGTMKGKKGWVAGNDLFGHQSCLESRRRYPFTLENYKGQSLPSSEMKRWVMIEIAAGTVQLPYDVVFPTQNSKTLAVEFSHIASFVPELKKEDIVRIWVEDK